MRSQTTERSTGWSSVAAAERCSRSGAACSRTRSPSGSPRQVLRSLPVSCARDRRGVRRQFKERRPDGEDRLALQRRGFVFQSAEIYGGFRSTYDYGPLGVNMLRNVKEAWWRSMVQERDDVVGIDAAVLSPPRVWEASGHLANFTDPLVDCRSCHERWRADQIDGVCPNCGSKDLTAARQFNLMFSTHVGPVADEGSIAYLRPETAQGMFTNFANVVTTTRKKPPFGIAQIGKAFRNEITPQNFVFRTREFDLMEMEYFVPPADAPKWFDYWLEQRHRWFIDLGMPTGDAPDPPP